MSPRFVSPIGLMAMTLAGMSTPGSASNLIVAGAWPQSEAALRVTGTRWEGLGAGHGYLAGRELSVHVTGRNGSGRRRSTLVHLPDVAAGIRQRGES